MLKIYDNNKIELTLRTIHIKGTMQNDFNSILENINHSLLEKVPVLWNIQLDDINYLFICNIKETYIINTKNQKFFRERIEIFTFLRNLLNDLEIQQKKIINSMMQPNLDRKVLEYELSLNLRGLNVLLNQEDFIYTPKNIVQKTIESLNYAISNSTISCIFDKIDNVESFRVFSSKKIYLIQKTINTQKSDYDLIVLDEDIINISNKVIEKVDKKRKLKKTKTLLDELKNNIKEKKI